jgi:hypothetical protein
VSVTRRNLRLKTRGGWRETPQDHRLGVYDTRDICELTSEELMVIAAGGMLPARRY